MLELTEEISAAVPINTQTTFNCFHAEKERWKKIKDSSPSMSEMSLIRRYAEIERDRQIFEENVSTVLLEGEVEGGVRVRCFIGQKYVVISLVDFTSSGSLCHTAETIPKLKQVILRNHEHVEFDDTII